MLANYQEQSNQKQKEYIESMTPINTQLNTPSPGLDTLVKDNSLTSVSPSSTILIPKAPTSGMESTTKEAAYLNLVNDYLQISNIWNNNLIQSYLNWFHTSYLVNLFNRTTTEEPHPAPLKWVVSVPAVLTGERIGQFKDPTKGDVILPEDLGKVDIIRSTNPNDVVCPIPTYTKPTPLDPILSPIDPNKGLHIKTAPKGDTIPVGTILTDDEGNKWMRKWSPNPFRASGYDFYEIVG